MATLTNPTANTVTLSNQDNPSTPYPFRLLIDDTHFLFIESPFLLLIGDEGVSDDVAMFNEQANSPTLTNQLAN